MTSLELLTYDGQFVSNGIKIAAKYCEVDLKLVTKNPGVSATDADVLCCNPIGRLPVLRGDGVRLFESSSIARFIAAIRPEKGLLGKGVVEAAVVDQWVSAAGTELTSKYGSLVFPYLFPSMFPYVESTVKAETGQVLRVLGGMDRCLESRTFLASERITLADIVMVSALFPFFTTILTPDVRSKYRNVSRWYNTCINQREFVDILGEPKYCESAPVIPSAEPKTPAVADASARPSAPAEEPKDTAAAAPKENKPKHPLELLPPTPFVLDEWKRQYSNTDTRSAALPWFFENFDPQGYSIFYCNYKYSNELAKTFMAANLISGWFQRVEHLRKYMFGSVHVFGASGEPGSVAISGVWIFRGPEIPAEIVEDGTDGECYEWRRLDLSNADDKALFEDYCAWDGEFKGGSDKPFNQGKTFK
uniref:Elongation factor 1-gamma n=1 Tax=Compsopogon caeruleus TaxID=31354 RepID=A0A7S1TG37_9RHOD|mmetsp:Transcript_4288/g.8456  ORF Transcript_4288/g.8456 Transcript_4288/m.8456 type:complete len:419 (+) Transcript_4288:152-1408(+)|eukprot:CAMPEP_0184680284 /NCGR_PEP_ID=MMETSP0312-20130426/3145_1 /TAXON_ID=31354 /ORGANISM="Compsopogon coeruleus, Strain SAG 36.94" /LENGTH=418 /DNA_ID=CAMNT_0027130275 /DNA_START=123 /DNA_END=1379 /DNA_ORIENTATION=-